MTGLPRLSVVVLTYNSGDTIAECLDSLVNQTYKDFEVIVVDDDSVDDTLSVVADYSSRLKISVVRNGAHNIPRGRNIGISSAQSGIVAFLDSDDCAGPDWARVIAETFRDHPETTMIGGQLIPAFRSAVGHAISMNDHAIRRLFLTGVLPYSAGATSVNVKMLGDRRYNESFKFGEDLELAARINEPGSKRYVKEINIFQYSRVSFPEYAKQMYKYGYMKVWVSFAARSFRWLDFIPLALLLGGAVACVATQTWWPVLLNVPFALAEAAFVTIYMRLPLKPAALSFPAWLVKNLSWSAGVACGLVSLAVDTNSRRVMGAQQVAGAS